MTPSQKATVIPKNFTQSANAYHGFNHRINNHSFDGTTYTTVPTMSTHRSHGNYKLNNNLFYNVYTDDNHFL